MRTFQFRLERVLDWRRLELESEEARFQRQAAVLAELDRARADVTEAARHAEAEVRAYSPLSGDHLGALAEFQAFVRRRETEIAAQRVEAVRKLDAQRAVMLEARRRFRLLERLRGRRWEEWRKAGDKELEELAGESYTAQWARNRPASI